MPPSQLLHRYLLLLAQPETGLKTLADLLQRRGAHHPQWLDLCVCAADVGNADQRQVLLAACQALQAALQREQQANLQDQPTRWQESPAVLAQGAAVQVLVACGKRLEPGATPHEPTPGLPGGLLAPREAWLFAAAEHNLVVLRQTGNTQSMQWHPPNAAAATRRGQCALPVLLHDPLQKTGVVATLTLWRVAAPGARLALVPAPASALTPLSADFAQCLADVSSYLRSVLLHTVDGLNLQDTALAWDLCPQRADVCLSALSGDSAGAAFALGALWLLADAAPPALAVSLQRIDDASPLLGTAVTAALAHDGALRAVGKPWAKGISLQPFSRAWGAQGGVPVHVARHQPIQPDPAETAPPQFIRQDTLADVVAHVAQRADPLTPAQATLLQALLGPDDCPTMANPVLVQVAKDPVTTLRHYLLHHWAVWERKLDGQVHALFVPLEVVVSPGDKQRDLVDTKPYTHLPTLLAEQDHTGHDAYVLRGTAGAGKTTLLRHHLQHLCRQGLQRLSSGQPPDELPIYLRLADLPQAPSTGADAPAHLQADTETPLAWLHRTLKAPPAVVGLLQPPGPQGRSMPLRLLLDGLNEIKVADPHDRRSRAGEVVKSLLDTLAPGMPALLSIRTQHFDTLDNLKLLPVTLLPWADDDMRAYMAKRFGSADLAATHWQALTASPPALALCRTPMQLAGQCDLIQAGFSTPVEDRATLFAAWLWQRLRRELGVNQTPPRSPNPELLRPGLLSADDLAAIRHDTAWRTSRLRRPPLQGLLLRSLFEQARRQWRNGSGPTHQRGEVVVPWSSTALGLGAQRSPWGLAVAALGLAEVDEVADTFNFSHQSWGEYLASAGWLPPTPADMPVGQLAQLLDDIQAPAFAQASAQADLQHQVTQGHARWQQVPQTVWNALLAGGLPLHWPTVRQGFIDSGVGSTSVDEFQQALESEEALTVDASTGAGHLSLAAYAKAFGLEQQLGPSPLAWPQRPEAWQLLLTQLLPAGALQAAAQQRLGTLAAGLWAQQVALALPGPRDLDDVLLLAVQGLADPVPWLRWLCLQGRWRAAARCARAVLHRLEGAGAQAQLQAAAAPLLGHLRRLLLRSVDAGASVAASLAPVLATLDAGPVPADDDLRTQWQQARQEAFKGDGLDLRLQLEAGLLLGALGDLLRYEAVAVPVWGGQGEVQALRLKAAHWVRIGDPGQQTMFGFGDDAGDKDEKPAFSEPLSGFKMAAYPVTVGEWQGFVAAGGYVDPQAPWWQAAGRLAQAWLAGRLASTNGRAVTPRFWRDERFNNPLQPVVGITAHEALAYSHWAAQVVYADVQDGLAVALPTEICWEAGVRGPAADAASTQRWPGVAPAAWAGAVPPPLLFNDRASAWGRTSPVGVFSRSNTPSGVADAAGNVWEWCSSDHRGGYSSSGKAAASQPSSGGDPDARRGVRGGSCGGPADYCRVAYRIHLLPGLDDNDLGCRLVRV